MFVRNKIIIATLFIKGRTKGKQNVKMITDYINLPIFLISFAIGLFFVYAIGPEKKTVFVYPTPENYTKIQYKDNVGQCFQYKTENVDCPINPFSIHTIPAQTSG